MEVSNSAVRTHVGQFLAAGGAGDPLFTSGAAERTDAPGVGESVKSVVTGGWGARLGWVDPITLAIKDGIPFTNRVGPGFAIFAPVLWLGLAWCSGGMGGSQPNRELIRRVA